MSFLLQYGSFLWPAHSEVKNLSPIVTASKEENTLASRPIEMATPIEE